MKQFRREMAKLSSIQKNSNRLKLIEKFSVKRKSLKQKIMNKSLSIEERLQIQNKLNDLPRNSSSIRFRNRCKLTGRTRGVYRKFGLSRIKIRELALSDMLARIKNAHKARKSFTSCYKSKLNLNVLTVLKEEGYIRDFKNIEVRKGISNIQIDLKYYNGDPVIKNIKRVSKPGIRVYSKISDLPKIYGGLGISILSTPKGVMSDNQARKNNVGGEILCEVF